MTPPPLGGDATLERLDRLPFDTADAGGAAVVAAMRRMAAAARDGCAALRPARNTTPALRSAFADLLGLPEHLDEDAARRFLAERFAPYRIGAEAFFTGYYEPIVDGALKRSDAFVAPILARPDDLLTYTADEPRPDWAVDRMAARMGADGVRTPYPDRRAIEAAALEGAYRPVVWLRDWIEVFMIQVQGSARVRLPDGRVLRLTYAGRNGHPYTSIGRLLVESGAIAPDAMSLAQLKAWVRRNGQEPGEPGRDLLQRNASYIFFAAGDDASGGGPVGGAGVGLTPLVSIAVDRTCWCYGLPFWVDLTAPWAGETATPLRRLMLAEDTGSAIVGPARVDLFLGSGDAAGRRAGDIRHGGSLTVLLPHAAAPDR